MNDNEYGFNPYGEPKNEEPESSENETREETPVNEPIASQPQQDADFEPEEVPETETYNAYGGNYGSGQQFNRYRDPVDDAPRQNSESAYSPYSERTYNQPPYQQNAQYGAPQSFDVQPEKKKKNKGFKGFLIALCAIVLCAAVLLAVYPRLGNKKDLKKTESGDSTQIKISDSSSLGEASKNSVAIAETAQKFNVGILLYGSKNQPFTSSATNSLVGEGSGIVMGTDSSKKYTYIITCAHVISEVKTAGYTMTVQDCDGNTYDGIMVGYDSKTDVGVIKIEKTGLTPAEFGDSSKLVIGQQVYAIGNPGGVEFFGSFTNGMISAIDRPINSESGYEMKCIQHTTPINSGNSGGALLNEYGQVIGINSSKIVSTGYEGMAFAIPITDAKPIIDDIISNGYVTNRPKLGISYVTASQYREYSMIVALKELPAGSLIIASISDDSALANTKAKVGDMIIAVNGEDLTSADVLLDKIENGKVGDTLKLTLCRINDDYSVDKFTVDVKLVEDDGTGSETEQTTTTQNYWEQFFGGGY